MDTTAPESTNTEMYQATEQSLLITHDRQAFKIQNVAKIQCQAEAEAQDNVQLQFYEVDNQDIRRICLKRESEERDVEQKCRPSPQQCPHQEERGRSILKKQTANTSEAAPRQPHGDQDVPQGVGSPLAAHPGNRMPTGTGDGTQQQTAFQDALRQCYTDYANSWSCSRKQEHTQALKAAVPTPTQSPAPKSFKLKSMVTVVGPTSQTRHRSCSCNQRRVREMPVWHPGHRAPYHLIGIREVAGQEDRESEKDFLHYLTNWFSWDYYSLELNDFGNAFSAKTVFVTWSCMAEVLYFEVTWTRGEKWIFPLIPELMTQTPMKHGGMLPEKPASLRG